MRTIVVEFVAHTSVSIEVGDDFEPALADADFWDRAWEKLERSGSDYADWQIDDEAFDKEYCQV